MPPRRREPSAESVEARETAENIADVALSAVWESARSVSAAVRETSIEEVFQEHQHWRNNGNGSCFLHAEAHAVGYMHRAEDTLDERMAAALRDVLAAAALCFIYQGRFRSKTAYDRATAGHRALRGVAFQLAEKRAHLLGVEVPNSRPGTRGSTGSWHERMVTAVYDTYATEKQQLPVTAFMLVAELERVTVVLFVRDKDGRLVQAQYNGQPLAFAPQDGPSRSTVFILHCTGGRETGPADSAAVTPNHYVYLHHGSRGDPVQRSHMPGTDGWLQEMKASMDHVVTMAARGAPPPPAQQQQEQLSQEQEQQEQLSQEQEQQQQQHQQEQEQQQQQPQQQQHKGTSKKQRPRKTAQWRKTKKQSGHFKLTCCLCDEVLLLAPKRPGATLSKHVREAHSDVTVQPLIAQVTELCGQQDAAVSVPQSLIKWASTARCCDKCHRLMSEPSSVCVSCRRAVSNGNSSNNNSSSSSSSSSNQDSSGSENSQESNNSQDSSSGDSSSTGSESESDSDDSERSGDGGSDNDSGEQQKDATAPKQSDQRNNPYAKKQQPAAKRSVVSEGPTTGHKHCSYAEPVMQPTWTQNDASIAAALDSITEAKMILIRNITTARTSRSPRQRKQFAAVMTWVQWLLKQALDARRESALATAAGAGCTQARHAELSVTRAAKLLYFVPVLAYGRQMRGKGVKPKERMDALYTGTFAAALQMYIDAHRPTADSLAEQQTRSQHQTAATQPASVVDQCPVSDADKGWTESDRQLHESCAELAGQRGGVAQAARKLEAREQHAPADEATQQVLRDKHPAAGSREGVTDTAPDAVRAAAKAALKRLADRLDKSGDSDVSIEVTFEDVVAALSRASAGKAAGPDGMRYEHAWAALKGDIISACPSYNSAEEDSVEHESVTFTHATAQVFTALLNEPSLLPEESWRLLRAANLCGLGVKRRPVACASVWRRLMASIAARKLGPTVGPLLQQLSQLGCGVPSGVEHVATTTRIWQQTLGTVIQLDCANAFNSVDRLAILRGLERFCPELLPYFESVYCGATMPEMRAELRKCDGAQKDAVYITLSELGCQQGDPLGPLLFAVAIAHALNPEDECDAAEASEAVPDAGQTAVRNAVGLHVAYLDDLNLLVNSVIDEQVVDRVLTTQTRLASIGLKANLTKSLAVAQQGHTFGAAERAALQSLNIPFVDASTAAHEQGFVTVGVPVGTKRYVEEQLRGKLMEKSLWRFAWQLVGLAETNLQAAMIIFRGSFTRRFGYVARNVDPRESAVWLSGYDGVCAWVFERMLSIHGATSASDVQQHILAACLAGDGDAASNPEALIMLSAGPVGLESLPLKVARLQQGAGGLGLTALGASCAAPYVAQLQVTLQSSLEQVLPDTEQAPAGFAAWEPVVAYHAALHTLVTATDITQRQMKRGPGSELLQWASDESLDDFDSDQQAFSAVFAAPLTTDEIDMTDEQDDDDEGPSTAQQNTKHAVQRSQSRLSDSGSGSTRRNKYKGLQRRLVALFQRRAMQDLMQMLTGAGDNGRLFLAQLRSQRAPFAMAWLGHAGLGELSTLETATMLLISVGIEPWNLQGDAVGVIKCGFCKRDYPTANHMMGCEKQHLRGHNAVHTGQKVCVQGLLRHVCGFRSHEVWNENRSMYTVPVDKEVVLQADTALAPRSLSLCGDQLLTQQGVVLDSSITSVTTTENMSGVMSNAAITDGHASARRERSKHRKHNGRYVTSRWKFVPFVQESHGRLGKEAAQILKFIAEQAAQRSGGTKHMITEKRSRILVTIKNRLSMSLARQMTQRIFAHVRGSAVHGQYPQPPSALIDLSKVTE